MGGLKDIEEKLKQTPGLIVVGRKDALFPLDPIKVINSPPDYILQHVRIVVAPEKGIYTPEGLNQIIDSLLPGIRSSSREHCKKYNFGMSMGHIVYDENIGFYRCSIMADINDPEIRKALKGFDGKSSTKVEEIEHNLIRRIFVIPSPDENMGNDLLANHIENYWWHNFRIKQYGGKEGVEGAQTGLRGLCKH